MESVTLSIEGVSVMIGMPVDNPIPHKTSLSLAMTMYATGMRRMPVSVAMEISGIIQCGRDAVLDDFLNSDYQKLFWIDSDMVWNTDDFLKMVALSTRYDVICASYPVKIAEKKSFIAKQSGILRPDELGMVEVEGVGLGFTVIDRKVAEAVAKDKPVVIDQMTGRSMKSVFRVDIVDGHRRTEDMAFFADIRDAGFKVMMDPEIELGHIGENEWRGKFSETFSKDKAA